MAADPTGHRFTIRSGDTFAEISQVGAALRAFAVGEVDIVPRYPDGIPTPAASGIVLVPWPNRVRDGLWTQRGQTRQLAITEPKYNNASHGLLRFAPYTLIAETVDSVTLGAELVPQTGYPFHLATEVEYRASDGELHVTHRIRNVGRQEAPVALGTHPYFCVGDVATADLTIQLDANTRYEVDERMLPIGQGPVDAATDLRRPRRLGDVSLDTAYGQVARDSEDRIGAVLTAPDGRTVDVWAGTGFVHLQVFTTDRYPGQDLAVAIEPMTAPADAFNSGQGLRWLPPDEQWLLEWGVRYTA